MFPVFCLLFIIVVAFDESFAQYEMTEYVTSNGGGRSVGRRLEAQISSPLKIGKGKNDLCDLKYQL